MGMTEQRDRFINLKNLASNESRSKKDRIAAWCEWGRMSRSVHDMAVALAAIQDLNNASK